ncbi:MAG: hypothetical protein ACOWWO_19505 [Peptococcaceae bacterium]
MSILLGVSVGISALIFIFLIMVIFTPVQYKILLGKKDTIFFTADFTGGWLYRLVICHEKNHTNIRFSLLGISFHSPLKKRKAARKKVKSNSRQKKISPAYLPGNILKNKDFLKTAWQTLGEILITIKPQQLNFKARIGMNDPYYTGMVVGAAAALTNINDSYALNVIPLWDEELLEGEVSIRGSLITAIILHKLLKLLFTKAAFNFWLDLKRSKLKNPAT